MVAIDGKRTYFTHRNGMAVFTATRVCRFLKNSQRETVKRPTDTEQQTSHPRKPRWPYLAASLTSPVFLKHQSLASEKLWNWWMFGIVIRNVQSVIIGSINSLIRQSIAHTSISNRFALHLSCIGLLPVVENIIANSDRQYTSSLRPSANFATELIWFIVIEQKIQNLVKFAFLELWTLVNRIECNLSYP